MVTVRMLRKVVLRLMVDANENILKNENLTCAVATRDHAVNVTGDLACIFAFRPEAQI